MVKINLNEEFCEFADYYMEYYAGMDMKTEKEIIKVTPVFISGTKEQIKEEIENVTKQYSKRAPNGKVIVPVKPLTNEERRESLRMFREEIERKR